MKKRSKILFFVVAMSLMILSMPIACFAESFGDITPTLAGNAYQPYTDEYSSEANLTKYTELTDKAYQIGLFGGGLPIATYVGYSPSNSPQRVLFGVFVAAPFGYTEDDKITGFDIQLNASGTTKKLQAIRPDGSYAQICQYELLSNGCWNLKGVSSSHTVGAANVFICNIFLSESWVFGYNQSSDWASVSVEPTVSEEVWSEFERLIASYDSVLGGSSVGGDGFDEGFEQGYTAGYEDGYSDGDAEGYVAGYTAGYDAGKLSTPIEVDVPAIFDGYVNGITSILGSFNMNIFGINIAGMLVGILVVVIVAFIVRKVR